MQKNNSHVQCKNQLPRVNDIDHTRGRPTSTTVSTGRLFILLLVIHYVTLSPKSAVICCTPKISRINLCHLSPNLQSSVFQTLLQTSPYPCYAFYSLHLIHVTYAVLSSFVYLCPLLFV